MKNYLIGIIILLIATISFADTINITSGTADPIPLAINKFAGVDPADIKIAKDVVSVIVNDLN